MQLITFSGLRGGKSTLAEKLARHLGIPVFAKDWLEAIYCPWEGERLVLDMADPFNGNYLKARIYCE